MKRTLYECSHAQVIRERILCSEGHQLSSVSSDGGIEAERLALGEKLTFKVCQGCSDFDCAGPPLAPEERGWLKKEMKK